MTGISGDGSTIVGTSYGQRSGRYAVRWDTDGRAFVWDQAHGLRDLQMLLEGLGLDLDGWSLREAIDVAADGRTIVGIGDRSVGGAFPQRQAFIAVIPEPSTAVMMVLGLAGLCIRGGRRVSVHARA